MIHLQKTYVNMEESKRKWSHKPVAKEVATHRRGEIIARISKTSPTVKAGRAVGGREGRLSKFMIFLRWHAV
jgi:hypothetical protein